MGKVCIKCNYERTEIDKITPEYECPKCGVIYAKAEKNTLNQPDFEDINLSDEEKIRNIKIKSQKVKNLETYTLLTKTSTKLKQNKTSSLYVAMENPHTGIVREIKVGFSWTTFFFGGFVFLFRGMYTHALLWIFLQIITGNISTLILMFKINKMTALNFFDNKYIPIGNKQNWIRAMVLWGFSQSKQKEISENIINENYVSGGYKFKTLTLVIFLILILMSILTSTEYYKYKDKEQNLLRYPDKIAVDKLLSNISVDDKNYYILIAVAKEIVNSNYCTNEEIIEADGIILNEQKTEYYFKCNENITIAFKNDGDTNIKLNVTHYE